MFRIKKVYSKVEILWIKNLLNDLKVSIHLPIERFYDNESTIQIPDNHVFHERSNHISIDVHFKRENVFLVLFAKTVKIESSKQEAYIFTKGL